MLKNVASQKWVVFAFQDEGGANPGEPVTGDAAQITANLYLDGSASANAVDDTNPTELAVGYYVFDITAAESNADNIVIAPASSTANVNVVGVPGAVYTDQSYDRLGAPAGASVSADLVTIDANVDLIVADTGTDGVLLNLAQALPGSPTADTVGDALKQATREEAPKRAVALNDIPIYLVSSSDHVTPSTGLLAASPVTVVTEVSKDGGAFGAGGGTLSEVGNGVYMYDASAADMTADSVVIKVTATGVDPTVVAISTVD